MFKDSWLRPLVAAGAGLLIAASAFATPVTVDFESVADSPSNFGIGGLYFPGDSFTQRGFRMIVDFDAGIVGPGSTPSGNGTAFYTQSNQGGLLFVRDDPEYFSLLSFDAGAVRQPGTPSTVVSYLAAVSVDATFDFTNPVDVQFFALPSSGFATFSPLGTGFDMVYGIEFIGCLGTSSGPTQCGQSDNMQFALDNLQFNVPEPSSAAIVALALFGLGLSRRRAGR